MSEVGISARIERPNVSGPFDVYYREAQQVMERAALQATKAAGRAGLRRLRSEIQGAGLGRLGNALGATSDLEKNNGVKRYPNGGFSTSGTVFIRSRSERTRGAIEAYTQGAEIRPVRSRWLWIATDEVQRIVGSGKDKRRLTPALWKPGGLESKIGPLVMIRSVNGNPLLVVRNIGVSAAGLPRKAKRLNKSGRPAKGQRLKEFVVAFVGIPRTARAARIDVSAILREVAADLPRLFELEMRRVARGR